jgi:acetyl-CoA carboxylase biotin carboxylase subunit
MGTSPSRARRIRKVLVANRGEIAVRVMRTCRELGIVPAAVYSDPDRHALHVRLADEAYALPGAAPRDTYLNQEKILDAARKAGAEAIHPGYGFLSENASFSRACRESGIIFIGPGPESIEMMGEKTRARETMSRAGVAVVPGTPPLADEEEARAAAGRIGYPVLIKAAGGGGGKGMRKVERPAELGGAFEACRREALSAFGDGRVYIEKFLREPHHIEFQVLADGTGKAVHLFERECSVQRRHQKIIEETPSPLMTEELREEMGEAAVKAARACGYVNAGTIEFLVDADRRFYFLEMNTRLQVEHPITEMITGVDLVAKQIEIAAGGTLRGFAPERRGHAVECRIYAEDPWNGFIPSPGLVRRLAVPGGPGIRDDSGVYAGFTIPLEYDPLISKLVAWGESRERALARMRRALEEYQIVGIRTNIPYLRRILAHPDFAKGRYDTQFIDKKQDELLREDGDGPDDAAWAAAAILAWFADEHGPVLSFTAQAPSSAWKLSGRPGDRER